MTIVSAPTSTARKTLNDARVVSAGVGAAPGVRRPRPPLCLPQKLLTSMLQQFVAIAMLLKVISFENASSFVQPLSQPVRSRFMLPRGRRDRAQLQATEKTRTKIAFGRLLILMVPLVSQTPGEMLFLIPQLNRFGRRIAGILPSKQNCLSLGECAVPDECYDQACR